MTDLIPNQRIEIDMAFKTPKRDEDEDAFKPDDANSPEPTTLRNVPEIQLEVILTMVTKQHGETNDKYRC